MFHSGDDRRQRSAKRFREGLASGRLMRFPGAFNPLSAMLIERLGFEGVYVSGAVISASLGAPGRRPDHSQRGGRSEPRDRPGTTGVPTIVDADTGFGEPLNAARTVQVLEELGLSGCHIEDQVNPKRCGHLDGKEMVTGRRDAPAHQGRGGRRPRPRVCHLRSNGRACRRGPRPAIERAKSYLDAGADMIFPEALEGCRRAREVQAGRRRAHSCQHDRVRQD